MIQFRDRVAQWIAHLTSNQGVVGSSPIVVGLFWHRRVRRHAGAAVSVWSGSSAVIVASVRADVTCGRCCSRLDWTSRVFLMLGRIPRAEMSRA